MPHIIGTKGQLVIEKEIRDQLGIQPGWIAVQRVVDDHIEVWFQPPEHDRSMKGSLASHTRVKVPPGDSWEKARESAWKKQIRNRR
jgi:AbrB family looped-hinge helix DNA binding protein